MSEIRRDPLLGYEVVIAPGREARPQQWSTAPVVADQSLSCPFCPGQESTTPHEVLVLPHVEGRAPDSPQWQVRVIPNAFPSLNSDPLEPCGPVDDLFFVARPAHGMQDVVIETPEHVAWVSQIPDQNLIWTFQAYQTRLRQIAATRQYRYAQVFKNCGPAAGASLQHTHSQIMASQEVPQWIAAELEASGNYCASHGHTFWEELIRRELGLGVRVVYADEDLVAFCPFASRLPLETWIFPRAAQADFRQAKSALLEKLAIVTKRLLAQIEKASNYAPYNFLIHTSPFDTIAPEHYHWHLEILPRVTVRAGFEWGTGMFVNPIAPERAAQAITQAE